MSFRKFKFISPGVFVNEVDNSQRSREIGDVGPVLIGRATKGPGLKPITVSSFDEFVQTFGNPVPGGTGGDAWRSGEKSAPIYATYAAQAWLRNSSPLTYVRLLGKTHADATTAGYAGWQTTKTALTTNRTTNGGAWGLFIVEGTGSENIGAGPAVAQTGDGFQEGTLAAVWYLNEGSIMLSGTDLNSTGLEGTGAAQFFEPVGAYLNFKCVIKDSSGNVVIDAPFNFTENSPRYIRKVFNTSPTMTNSNIIEGDTNYWLGESFEGHLRTVQLSSSRQTNVTGISGSSTDGTFGIMLPLGVPNGNINGGYYRVSSTKDLNAATGWFVSQDFGGSGSYNPEANQKLFRLRAREYGEDAQRQVKISIKDIRASTDPYNEYGTFSVVVRDIKDTDNAPIVLEQYNKCNLNPASDNYIAKKIGNTSFTWSDTNRRYTQQGEYPNKSTWIRVQLNEDIDRGVTNPECLPFGVFGPPRYQGFACSGSDGYNFAVTTENAGAEGPFVMSGAAPDRDGSSFVTGSDDDGNGVLARFRFPTLRLKISASEGSIPDAKDAYFGVDTTYKSGKFDKTVLDVIRTKADSINNLTTDSDYTETPWVFSLDDVRNMNIQDRDTLQATYGEDYVFQSGSRKNGTSYTAHTGTVYLTASYRNVLDAGIDRFTTCLHGGFNGLDIKEREPFNMTRALEETDTEISSYAYNSLKMAMDMCRDPERVEMNAIAMPGITNNGLNSALVKMCEERGDALAVIDLKGGYKPDTEDSSSHSSRVGSVDTTVDNLRDELKLNSSYGCTYYPWVRIRDNINGASLWAPPSVVALGAMSYGQATSQLWFAPAGFTRGGLSANNAAGIPVVNVEQRLTSKERDKLYEANINPIASFPAEGIVIFGQKTLQVTPSALDRINVRRLLIHLKRQISRMASTVLFDQNVESTWARFTSAAEPFLRTVKAGLGITDYRLILDRSTTTPDLIDRNIMYAKVIIKPARAIEYIAIDFVITDTGAAFED